MDIDLLAKMVGELVTESDRVSLPGLGTFVAEEVPASFSDRGFTINPPYRRLSFSASASDDTLLADLYSRSNDIEREASETILKEFLEELRQTLVETKNVVLPGLGRLRATRENAFFFVPEPDLEIFPDGFGLAPVSLKSHENSMPQLDFASIAGLASEPKAEPDQIPVPQTVPEPVQIPEPEPEPEPEPASEFAEETEEPAEPRRRASRLWWIIPLAVVLAAGLALAVFLILAHVAPDFIDSILYTEEELRILNY